MAEYVALIHGCEGCYGVSFPDFPGCVTAGATRDDARAMASEALALHVDGLLDDGEALPAPSSLVELMEECEDAVALLVSLPARTPKF